MFQSVKNIAHSVLDLFFPNLCIYCDNRCQSSEEVFCLKCQKIQSPTDLHLFKDNEFTRHFFGRVEIYTGASLYYYSPGGVVHSLLEQIKYRGKSEYALRLGQYYGQMLKKSDHYADIDFITSVPMHPKKEALRGYNQSSVFGTGIAQELNKEFSSDMIKKVKENSSQTDKSRLERLSNIFGSFQFNEKSNILNKHILLVDDVLTTGATLEACVLELWKGQPASIRLACIAMGKN